MIQLALAVKDTVRIGSLQTSKNWESLEADMVKNESWIKGALTRLPFFMAVPGDLHIWASLYVAFKMSPY